MSYITATICTLAAWFVGLIIEANLGSGDFCLRMLFPLIAMGICIMKDNRTK